MVEEWKCWALDVASGLDPLENLESLLAAQLLKTKART